MLWVSAQTQAEGTVHSQHADPAGARDEKDTAAAQEGPQVCEYTVHKYACVYPGVYGHGCAQGAFPTCVQVCTGVHRCG